MQQFEIVSCGVLKALHIVFAGAFDGGAGLGGVAHLLQHLQYKGIVADDLLFGGVGICLGKTNKSARAVGKNVENRIAVVVGAGGDFDARWGRCRHQ